MDEIARRLAARLFDTPIIENHYRSAFVEAMIEPRLAVSGWRYTGGAWGGWDFEHQDSTRLEVKQSAAQQTWSAGRKLRTRPTFDIARRTGYYSQGASSWTPTPGRPAHLYVFAYHDGYGPEADHRDPQQWDFYVVPATVLPEGQKTISLAKIVGLIVANEAMPVGIDQLPASVSRCRSELRLGKPLSHTQDKRVCGSGCSLLS